MTNPDNPNIINFDLWKQAAGGRHQIGTLAGFRSEQVAGFLLECMAGFVGIRTPNDLLRMWPVSKRANVSGRGDDDPGLIQPVEDEAIATS